MVLDRGVPKAHSYFKVERVIVSKARKLFYMNKNAPIFTDGSIKS